MGAQEIENDAVLMGLNESFIEMEQQMIERLNSSKNNEMKKEMRMNMKQMAITIKEMKLEMQSLQNKDEWKQIVDENQRKYEFLLNQLQKQQQNQTSHNGKDYQMKNDTNALIQCQKELEETELNAIDCMNVLNEQTEQIKKIKSNVKESNSLLEN